jgi:predicted amidohydrolase
MNSFSISGNLADVHSQTIYPAEIVVTNGKIAAINRISGTELPTHGYILPGFIDAHVHLLSGAIWMNTAQLQEVGTKEDLTKVLQGFALNPGQSLDCIGTAGNNNVACLGFTTTYVVAAADVPLERHDCGPGAGGCR